MTRITLDPAEARRLAVGALAAASPDDFAPLITGGQLSVAADGKVTMVATDRYRVHRMFTNAIPVAEENRTEDGGAVWDEGTVVVPRYALKWIVANALKLKSYAHVVIEFDVPSERLANDGRIKVEVRSGYPGNNLLPDEDGFYAYACRPIAGTYPPVARLFDGLQAPTEPDTKGTVLNVDYMAALGALKRGKYKPNTRIRLSKASDAGKPGPVGFQFEDENGVFADAIIQPVLDLR